MSHAIIMNYPKFSVNVGTVMRTAELMGADKVVVSDPSRVSSIRHATDTAKSYRRIGMTTDTLTEAISLFPGRRIITIEMSDNAVTLDDYDHPEDAVYILGSEDKGIDLDTYGHLIDDVITIPSDRSWSLNVAIAHSMVEWDRRMKTRVREPLLSST